MTTAFCSDPTRLRRLDRASNGLQEERYDRLAR